MFLRLDFVVFFSIFKSQIMVFRFKKNFPFSSTLFFLHHQLNLFLPTNLQSLFHFRKRKKLLQNGKLVEKRLSTKLKFCLWEKNFGFSQNFKNKISKFMFLICFFQKFVFFQWEKKIFYKTVILFLKLFFKIFFSLLLFLI